MDRRLSTFFFGALVSMLMGFPVLGIAQPGVSAGADVWIKDCERDSGVVPSSPQPCDVWWKSPDIMVDNNLDGERDGIINGRSNTVRVTVRNRGQASARGATVRLYTYSTRTPSTPPRLDAAKLVSQQTISLRAEGESTISFEWNAPRASVGVRDGWRCFGVVSNYRSDHANRSANPATDNNKAVSCTKPIQDIVQTRHVFSIGYIDTNWRLRIRWSEDGVNWNSASGSNAYIDYGPGIATDGAAYLSVFGDSIAQAKMLMGTGPEHWDASPTTIGGGYSGEIRSGTSIAHLGGTNWIVAYLHSNQAKLMTLDTSPAVRDFRTTVTPVSGVTNSNVIDRPSIANRNGRLVASWLMENRLQIVPGNVQNGAPVWQAGYVFDSNFAEAGYESAVGAHALAQDGEKFYLAIVRRRDPLPGELVRHYFLFVYTSDNGEHWTKLAQREIAKIPHSLGIAARGPSDIIVISSYQYTELGNTVAYRFNGSSWANLDGTILFGANSMANGHDFTLFANP